MNDVHYEYNAEGQLIAVHIIRPHQETTITKILADIDDRITHTKNPYTIAAYIGTKHIILQHLENLYKEGGWK